MWSPHGVRGRFHHHCHSGMSTECVKEATREGAKSKAARRIICLRCTLLSHAVNYAVVKRDRGLAKRAEIDRGCREVREEEGRRHLLIMLSFSITLSLCFCSLLFLPSLILHGSLLFFCRSLRNLVDMGFVIFWWCYLACCDWHPSFYGSSRYACLCFFGLHAAL